MNPADVIRILAVLTACVLACASLFVFNQRCEKKFQYRFFSKKALTTWAGSSGCFFIGIVLLSSKAQEWIAPAWWLIGIGGVLLWFIVANNIIRTNVLYGIAGTLAQVIIVIFLGSTGAFIGIMIGGLILMALTMIVPVLVFTRRK